MAHPIRERFRFHLWHQFVRVLVLSFLLVPNVLTFFGIAYTASAKGLSQNTAVKSIALYLPPSTRSAYLQYTLRTGNQQTHCLNNVNPENWHTTYQFHASLAPGSQITVTPGSSTSCGGGQSQTFNIPQNPTNSQCRLNVENSQISGCTEKKSNTTVRSVRVYPPLYTNSVKVIYYMVGQSAPSTMCLKNAVPGTWTSGQNAFTAHRSFAPGSQITVITYLIAGCSGPTPRANTSFTVPNIGQTYNSTCWLDIGQKKMTGCNTGN
jgi:hypothetical protein